jgi:dTDP-4-dehydrorhamnose 3,5-epimerase
LEPTKIRDCFTFSGTSHTDIRGSLIKPYTKSDDLGTWLKTKPVQEIFWSDSGRGVFRGMHIQLPPHAVEKVVICLNGSVTDFVIDLRSDSKTFREALEIELGFEKGLMRGVSVPKGCAHGFFVNSAEATILYLQSGPRVEASEFGLHVSVLGRYREKLPKSVVLSERDSLLPNLDQFPELRTADWEIDV